MCGQSPTKRPNSEDYRSPARASPRHELSLPFAVQFRRNWFIGRRAYPAVAGSALMARVSPLVIC